MHHIWKFKLVYLHSFLNPMIQRLHSELPNAIIRQIPECGHIPHVEKPNSVAKLIVEFAREACYEDAQTIPL